MENLKKKLALANGKVEKFVAKQYNYKHFCIEGAEAKIVNKCSVRVKKFIKDSLKGGFDEKDVKHSIQLLFLELTGKAAWEEIVRVVRSVGERKDIEGLVEGLSEYLEKESEDDEPCSVSEGSQDMFASGDEEEKGRAKPIRKGGRKISFTRLDSDGNVEIRHKSVPAEIKKQMPMPKINSAKKVVNPQAGSSGSSRAAVNKKKALVKRQAKANEKTFDDEASEDLDRQYNEQVLKRKGSPEISSKKGTPAAPRKVRDKGSKSSTAVEKGRRLAKDYSMGDKTVYLRYTFGAMIIKGELGKLYNLAELKKKTDQGGRILDKAAAELATTFKCGFWPVCDGGVCSSDTLVRGGWVEKPIDHNKVGELVYICGDHSGQQVVDEVADDGGCSDDGSIGLKENNLCMDESGVVVEEEKTEGLMEDHGDVAGGGQEEEVLQSQSLLAGKK